MRILGTIASSSREVPNAPTIGTATDVGTSRTYTPQNGGATVTFTAPTWTGGLPILDYTVTSSPGGFTATGAGSPLTVNGLAPSTSYTFTVKARNSVGLSAASAASNSITATTVPAAPTIGTATRTNDTTVSLAFTAGATGGKTITSYTVTSSPSISLSTSGTSSPLTVTGTFASGQAYTFSITASNANGTSGSSGSSNSVIPLPAKPVVTGGTLTSDATYYYRTFTGNGTLGVSNSSLIADYLIVAGGGGGGMALRSGAPTRTANLLVYNGGGAGAGGLVYATSATITAGSYGVTIGAGGAAQTSVGTPVNGSNSALGGLQTASGGGGGGSGSTGGNGGSGGGGGYLYDQVAGPAFTGFAGGTASQGYAGGAGYNSLSSNGTAGGGGGAGVAGSNGTLSNGANGGDGLQIFGTYYAGGGASGGVLGGVASGGLGGGGTPNGGNGVANRGGGGAGYGTSSNGTFYGGSGGSGIVIVRYTKVQVD